ncbi:MAG: DNA translocase FtsK [Phototrophicaceae bacterium]
MTQQPRLPIVEEPEDDESYPVAPEVWERMLDVVPPWGDEIVALVLIIFGILSLLAVLNIGFDASIPRAWASTLKVLFGYGSLIVSGGMLILGVVLILPNVGVVVELPPSRVIALEVGFLAALALLHIVVSGNVETRAVARAGEGGGLVGWALSYPPMRLVGSVTVTVIYSAVLTVSLAFVLGVKRSSIQAWLRDVETRLNVRATQLLERPTANRRKRRLLEMRREEAARMRASRYGETKRPLLRAPLLRIRPDMERIPPSMRPGAPMPEVEKINAEEHPLFGGAVHGETFNIIGKPLSNDEKKMYSIDQPGRYVRRPDGRIKRYFSVGDLNEARKTGRRKKDSPPLDLLQDLGINLPEEDEINIKAVLIENTLLEFDIDIDVIDVRIGPTVTQYAIKPYREGKDDEVTQRTRIAKIASYQSDLALALSAKRLRIEAPVPGTNYVGIEVPNNNPSIVSLRAVYESKTYFEALQKAKTPLLVPLGRDVSGAPFIIDLATMPHTLVAGTTGSGKSVALAAFTMALVLHNTPNEVRLIMLDPKMVELTRFNGLPHLLGPVEIDTERIIGVLRWCTREMDERYRQLEEAGARNISIYNEKEREKGNKAVPLPYIVIMIDEVGDLMASNSQETEHHLTRLAQMARAVGMHLIVATQRPSVDVLTGLIKANFPGRIAFSVASGVDSRVIIDTVGAENLLGQGDMLFLSSDASGPRRLQGCYVSDDEVRGIVNWWQQWALERREEGKQEAPVTPWEKTLSKLEMLSATDDLLESALEAIVHSREASATMLQRQLNIGFPRASRIMDLLHELGAIGPPEPGGKMRKVLISSYTKDPMKDLMERRKKESQAQAREARQRRPPPTEYYDAEDDILTDVDE